MAGGHGMCGGGHVWQGACMVGGVRDGGGHAWQGDMRRRGACMACTPLPGRYYEIQSMSWRYTSYWNAFLLYTNSYLHQRVKQTEY